GPGSIVVKFGASQTTHIGLLSYQGVNQTSPIGGTTFVQNATNSTSAGLTLATTTANSVILSMVDSTSPNATTPGTGQNQRWQFAAQNATLGDDKFVGAAASYGMTYTLGGNKHAALQAVEIISCGAPTVTP